MTMDASISPRRDTGAESSGSSRRAFRLSFPRRNRSPKKPPLHQSNKKRGLDQRADATLLDIKLRILQKNPVLFQQFRETVQKAPAFTDWAAAHHLNEFLARLRIPELRDELRQKPVHQSGATGLLGYLQSSRKDESPQACLMRPVVTRISTSACVLMHASQEEADLSMPSLSTTEEGSDDESQSSGASIKSIRLEF